MWFVRMPRAWYATVVVQRSHDTLRLSPNAEKIEKRMKKNVMKLFKKKMGKYWTRRSFFFFLEWEWEQRMTTKAYWKKSRKSKKFKWTLLISGSFRSNKFLLMRITMRVLSMFVFVFRLRSSMTEYQIIESIKLSLSRRVPHILHSETI